MDKTIRLTGMLLALMLLLCSTAAAEGQEILLPDGTHRLTVPAEMNWQAPSEEEEDLKGIFLLPPELEMLIYAYDAQGVTTQELAEALVNAGRRAELREIAGTEFLVFQDTDEADGASCVGYSYISEQKMTEITFFYSTQAAMDLTRTIMESFQ